MSKEVIYKCDECGEEVNHNTANSIIVLTYQGLVDGTPDDSFIGKKGDDILKEWGDQCHHHKLSYNKTLCKNCLGENFQPNTGYGGKEYYIGDKQGKGNWVLRFLKKIGIISKTKRNRNVVQKNIVCHGDCVGGDLIKK